MFVKSKIKFPNKKIFLKKFIDKKNMISNEILVKKKNYKNIFFETKLSTKKISTSTTYHRKNIWPKNNFIEKII